MPPNGRRAVQPWCPAHVPDVRPSESQDRPVIRRHASALHAFLMLSDASVALLVVGLVSQLRFGAGWGTALQRLFTPSWAPRLLYAAGWVLLLYLAGQYRLRARWRLRTEATTPRDRSASRKYPRPAPMSTTGPSLNIEAYHAIVRRAWVGLAAKRYALTSPISGPLVRDFPSPTSPVRSSTVSPGSGFDGRRMLWLPFGSAAGSRHPP